MFDIVAPDQNQTAAAIDGGSVDHGEPRHPAAAGIGAEPIAGEAAYQPGGGANQRQNGQKCEKKHQWLR